MDTFKEQLLLEKKSIIARLEKIPDFLRLQFINNYLSTYSDIVNEESLVSNVHIKQDDGFPLEASRIEQIAYIIKTKNRFMHVSQIAEDLLPFWKNYTTSDVKGKVSFELSKARREGMGRITRVKIDNSNKKVYWGSSDWLTKEGEIKEEYMYEEVYPNKDKNQMNLL